MLANSVFYWLERNWYAPIFIDYFSVIFKHTADGSVHIHSLRVPEKLESTLLVNCSRVGACTFLVVRRIRDAIYRFCTKVNISPHSLATSL